LQQAEGYSAAHRSTRQQEKDIAQLIEALVIKRKDKAQLIEALVSKKKDKAQLIEVIVSF